MGILPRSCSNCIKQKFKSILSSRNSEEDMKNFARRRIQRELKKANDNPPSHCSYGATQNDDTFRWQGIIMGPSASPYEGGVFFLSIQFPLHYPYEPPKIKFLTKVFHPNIGEDGNVHIDILGKAWSPALGIEKLLLSICSILSDPVEKYHRRGLWNLYKLDRKAYILKAREWTLKYATLGLN
ncbi:ubiquitin-conjugating enzyme E2 4-like [Euphorbia lathyris]|uniref:ubiquitin-conjugating enzyme E2 4-like n=1 Tax=Euphorbia lathyris TaxID=212925 RepID=UPI003313D930